MRFDPGLLLESITDAFVAFDEQWRFTYVNAEAERVLGESRHQMLGKVLWQVCGYKLTQHTQAALQRAMHDREPAQFESTNHCGRWFDIKIQPVDHGVSVFFHDITQRRRAQEMIEASERRFRAVVESDSVGILVWHTDGRVLEANSTLLRMLGYSREDLEAGRLRWPDLTPAEYGPIDQQMVSALRSGRSFPTYEKQYIRKDGSRVPILIGSSFLPGSHDEGVAFVNDISNLKQAQARLLESQRRFRSVVETEAVGVMVARIDGHILDVNQTLADMLGYSREEIIGRVTWVDLTPPEFAEQERQLMRQLKETGRVPPYEKQYIRKDGSRVPVMLGLGMLPDTGNDEGVGFIIDMTRFHNARDAAMHHHRVMTTITNTATAGLFMVDTHGGITFMNPAAQQISGWQLDEVRGRNFHDTFQHHHKNGQIYPREDCVLLQALRDLRPLRNYETCLIRRDGSFVSVLCAVSPIIEDGRAQGAVIEARDITQEKLASERLRALTETLEQRVEQRTAELHARSQQLRMLASELTQAEQRERRRLAQTLHDHLQQLLVAAKLNLEMLRRRVDDADLAEAIGRSAKLVEDSIRASRTLTVELSPPVLHDRGFVAALEWLARQMLEKHHLPVEVHADTHEDHLAERFRTFLFEATRELLFNVVKHAHARRATVTVAHEEGPSLRVTVKDDGVGCNSEQIRFRRASGDGFGLFSIQQRIELLGGRFEFIGAPGQGCTVTLHVPVIESRRSPAAGPRTAPVVAGRPIGPSPAGPTRVLIADDHKIVREGLAGLLNDQPDIQVVAEAADGQAAIDMAHRFRPDVVVIDISMPVVDGIEATRQITRQLPGTRVIGLSMHEKADVAAAIREAGATAYLSKGGPADELVAAIRGSK